MTFYEDVRAIKRREVAALGARIRDLEEVARRRGDPRSLARALAAADPAIIAEVKRGSPSRGAVAPNLDAAAQAGAYARGGAAAISVLTEEVYFKGSLDDLEAASAAVSIPVLRKDFILDPGQIVEARARGADAVLLIVGFLEERALGELLGAARWLGMDALVEAHDEEELRAAARAGATIIGINNRNLKTLSVDLATAERLLPLVPRGACAVVESGIHSLADRDRLRRRGARAFLIGEHFVLAKDPAAAVAEFARA